MNKFRQTSWTRYVITALVLIVAAVCSSEARRRSRTVQPTTTEVIVGGVVGHTVHFVCNLTSSDPPNVQWFDEVYNEGEEPQLIYSSVIENAVSDETGDPKAVEANHPNRENFRIGNDYSLTISKFNTDQGPGKYFCRSTLDDGTVNELIYQLTVIDLPVCSGSTKLHSGQHMFLDCNLTYSGPNKPTVDWYRTPSEEHRRHHHGNSKHDDLISSVDESDILETSPLARKIVKNRAHPIDDGSTYRCKVSVGHLKKECDLKLSVQYLVQDLKISPEGTEAFVGDVIKCSALGNPTPTFQMEPRSDKSGRGWSSFVVDSDGELSVQCTASNTLNGTTEQLTTRRTFAISERPVPVGQVPETTTMRGHHQHDHVDHHSHPHDNKDDNPRQAVVADAQPVQVHSPGTASLTSGAVILTVMSVLFSVLALN